MGPAESVGMGPDVTTARWRVVTVVGAVVLAGVGWLLALSYNGAGALLIALALLLVAVSFPGARLPIGLALSSGVCAFAAWATLGGGANSWTAAPWVVGALILAAVAVVVGRGRSSG